MSTADRLLVVEVSGAAYSAVLDPRATDVPREEGWPVPTSHRRGRGRTLRYHLTRPQAESMAEHLVEVGSNFATFGDDPETRAEGRACLAAAARVRATIGATR